MSGYTVWYIFYWNIVICITSTFKTTVWLRITDESSVRKCAYGPYCQIESDLNGVYNLEEVSFLYCNASLYWYILEINVFININIVLFGF